MNYLKQKNSVESSVLTPAKPGFYGWVALSGVLISQFVLVGSFLISFGVFMPVMSTELGWSRGLVSTGFFIGLLCMGLPSPFWGFLISRFGPRTALIAGNVLMALALAGISQVQEIWHFYILYGLAGLGAGLGGGIVASTVANNWFARKRALALGTVSAAGCLGGFVFPPLITIFLSVIGWRTSWLVLAGMVLAGSILIGGLILVRNRPEDMGQLPDGTSVKPFGTVQQKENKPETRVPADWPAGKVLRQPVTWLIAAFTAANAFSLGATGGHQVAFIQDLGFSPMIAATTMSLVSITAIIGSLGFGTLALKRDLRYLTAVFFGIQLGAFSIILTTRELTSIYIYSLIFGAGNGALLSALPTFIGAYYGRSHYARILGILIPFQVFPQAAAAIVAGVIYDNFSSYIPAYFLMAAIILAGLICALLARQPRQVTVT